jgi:hypothetical protein
MVSPSPHRRSWFVRLAARVLRTQEEKIETWEHLMLTAFVVTVLVHGARGLHLLEGVEARWLDLMADVDRPTFDAPITVVAITDADFNDPSLFAGTSPLDPDVLRRVLARVLEHHPRGVIVDVQLHPVPHESEERRHARLQLYRLIESSLGGGGPPVILVRDSEAEARDQDCCDSVQAAWDRLTSDPRLAWADASFETYGGRVRSVRYGSQPMPPTLLGVAIRTFGLDAKRSVFWNLAEKERDDPAWRIRFTGYFLADTPFVSPYRTDVRALLSSPPVLGQRSLLAGRFVLVGGTYYAGRDLQSTVVGHMAGVYVWAEAIASWIRHDALREPRTAISFALEWLVGVVAGLLLVRFGSGFGLIYSLLIVTPLTIVCSLLTFGNRVLFVNFLPSFVGVYLHYQIDVQLVIRRLSKRVQDLERLLATEIHPGAAKARTETPPAAIEPHPSTAVPPPKKDP